MSSLCNSNKSAKIKFSIHNAATGREINVIEASVMDFLEGRLIHKAAADTTFQMLNFELRVIPTFVDYLRSGWAISMVCAIDYTASNGSPSQTSSLHYLG